ncbi:tripartite motif-containing protein 59-like [Antedon mediterranea]|uniref:tripartite motif-containing protein 59-like n=1 Tax=Antedon mediterranea TaxID=105859 RepID=UPI003AF641EB
MASNYLFGGIDEEVLECSICNRRLENQKSLSCHHRFCLKCLEKWIEINNGKLKCHTCQESYSIQVEGLQHLSPNTIPPINQHDKKDDGTAPLCSSHTQPLEMYCTKCKVPICIECTEIEHAEGDGKHEIIDILTAFNKFKEDSKEIKKSANDSIIRLENHLNVAKKNANELEECREESLADIDNQVQQMVQVIKKKADEMKKKVEEIYENEKKVNDEQMKKLKNINSELNTNVSMINHLFESEPAIATKSNEIN